MKTINSSIETIWYKYRVLELKVLKNCIVNKKGINSVHLFLLNEWFLFSFWFSDISNEFEIRKSNSSAVKKKTKIGKYVIKSKM